MENNLIQELLNGLGTDGEQEMLAKYIGSIMALPDERLVLVGPAIRSTIVDQYRNHNLKEELKRSGFNLDDLEALNTLMETLVVAIDSTEDISSEQKNFFRGLLNDFYNVVVEQMETSRLPIRLGVYKMVEDAHLPTYAHEGDSGMDIYTVEDVHLNPGETKLVSTGLSFEVPEGYELQIRPRSGLSLKTSLRVANSPATIDASYRGEVKVIVHNTTSPIQDIQYNYDDQQNIVIESIITGESIEFSAGSKIAQLILCKVEKATFVECDGLPSTDRGEGGFGSTGV